MTIDIISIRDCIGIERDPNEKFVFVIAPFDSDRTKIYESIIKPVVVKKRLDCKRADDFKTNTNKLNNIIRNIWKAEFIIADLTGLNPNVMYELGYAHAMSKEVIMIYEENKDKDKDLKFPFDIRYIEIKIYKNDITEAEKLKKDLDETIDYVVSNLTKTTMSDIKNFYYQKIDEEYKQSLISTFEIRKRRIHYFTYYVVKNLIYFRNKHYELEKLLEKCIKDPNEQNIREFTAIAKTIASFNKDYNFSFTQHLLNNSINFIANPWIVNKFLDYFNVFQGPLESASHISKFDFNNSTSILFSIQEMIKSNISHLDMCIDKLNEERKMVYLEVIDKE